MIYLSTNTAGLDEFIHSCSSNIDQSQDLINNYNPEDGVKIEDFLAEQIPPTPNISSLFVNIEEELEFSDVLLSLEDMGIF